MKKLLAALALTTALVSTAAMADTGPYIEGNLGYSATGTSSVQKARELVKKQDNHFGYNLNAGVLFLGFGAELGYTRYSDIQYHDSTGSAPADLYGLHLALKTQHSFGPIFIMGKIGYGQLHRGTFKVNQIQQDKTEKSGLYFGFGGGVKFMPTLAAVLQYQQIMGRGNMPDANLTSIGINWSLF